MYPGDRRKLPDGPRSSPRGKEELGARGPVWEGKAEGDGAGGAWSVESSGRRHFTLQDTNTQP